MDMFIEKMVARKRRGKDFAIAVTSVFSTILLSAIIFLLVISVPMLFFLAPLFPLLIASLIFLCYRIIAMQKVEFEYSLTNDELDIDKILAKRRRKRVVTLNARNIDILAPITNPRYQSEKSSAGLTNTYDCSNGTKNSDVYFVVFFNAGGLKSMLLFEPNQKMIDGFKRYSPQKVYEL